MMEEALRERYFEKVGHSFLISTQIKRMVRFEFFNLQTGNFPSSSSASGDVDLLFCRNVLIYFETETIRQIIEKFSQSLSPQGYLFMGHAETMQNVSDRFRRHHQNNAFFYQKKEITTKKDSGKVPAAKMQRAEKAVPASAKAASKSTVAAAAPSQDAPQQDQKAVCPDPEQLYRDALTAFDHERFADSTKLFEQLLEQQPANPKALIGKGLLLANQGKYADARICCARAIKENDLLPEAYLLRGLILDMEGLLERALVEYQKVLWLAPAFIMAHYLSAKVYDHLTDREKKLRSLRNTARALEQAPEQATVPFSGGLSRGVFLEIVRRELSEAITS